MKLNRRGFLKGVSCTAAPLLLPGCTALTFSSNEKIRVAVIGLGRIASSFEIPGVLARTDIARIVAVCDLDSRRLDFAKGNIEKFYREKGFAGGLENLFVVFENYASSFFCCSIVVLF